MAESSRRLILYKYAWIFVVIATCGVLLFFVLAHALVCSGSTMHPLPFPELSREQEVSVTDVPQQLGLRISNLAAESATVGNGTAPATQPGSPFEIAQMNTVRARFSSFGSFYTEALLIEKTANVVGSCRITLDFGTVQVTDATWFRVVKGTCITKSSAAPVLLVANETLATSALTGDVVVLFSPVPFAPVVGDVFAPLGTQPVIVQVDARMQSLFSAGVTVSVVAVNPSTAITQTYVYKPANVADEELTYTTVDLDSAYVAGDNWAAVALQLQLLDTFEHDSKVRQRTGFIFGVSGSGMRLVEANHITHVHAVVSLTACGLPNGRDALYTSASAAGEHLAIQPVTASIMYNSPAYISGVGKLSFFPVWSITSWSPTQKTLTEFGTAGGVPGVQVAPFDASPTGVSLSTDILLSCLISQLSTVAWLVSSLALAPTGAQELFVA
jgi:hypothetical protein